MAFLFAASSRATIYSASSTSRLPTASAARAPPISPSAVAALVRAETLANASVLASNTTRLSSKIAINSGTAASLLSCPKATTAFFDISPIRTSKARIKTASAAMFPILPSAATAASRTVSGSNGSSTISLSRGIALVSLSFPKATAACNRTSAFASESAVSSDVDARSSFRAPSETAAAARMDFVSSIFSRIAINGSTTRRSLNPPSDSAARLRTT